MYVGVCIPIWMCVSVWMCVKVCVWVCVHVLCECVHVLCICLCLGVCVCLCVCVVCLCVYVVLVVGTRSWSVLCTHTITPLFILVHLSQFSGFLQFKYVGSLYGNLTNTGWASYRPAVAESAQCQHSAEFMGPSFFWVRN